jgi:hypothetical protein
VILDKKKNIFGGFILGNGNHPGERRTRQMRVSRVFFRTEESAPLPGEQIFAEIPNGPSAIICNSELAPNFCDIFVSDHCNSNTKSCTAFGEFYTNNTGLDKSKFFTGLTNFEVAEIEVFEIVYLCPNSEMILGFPRLFEEFWGK